ncbi:MAG: gfo/Idh/MocA family oxidoreductase, partial [Planctomycetes bacterium]|nr:gfo/Idh/MocA family oxidoreductase [Planctomycetota bacterium]
LQVSSFGSLKHFTEANAPEGATDRCTGGCPHVNTCPYNAMLYASSQKGWLPTVYDRAEEASQEELFAWLDTSPWGRCAYKCDNTVVDHQTVNMLFENEITCTFTMTAFDSGRSMEIMGTKAVLVGGARTQRQAGVEFMVIEHDGGNKTSYNVAAQVGGYASHGGADAGIMQALHGEMSKDSADDMTSTISDSVQSHIMGFAAEESRVSGKTIVLDDFAKEFAAQ